MAIIFVEPSGGGIDPVVAMDTNFPVIISINSQS